MISDWLNIDFEVFHLLRPKLMWLLVPIILVLIVSMLVGQFENRWKGVIAKHLQDYVIVKGNRFATVGPQVLFLLITSLITLSAAGPTWKKIDVPGAKSEATLLIALDLSPSMMVEDVSPNRLERAKFKIRDLLEANPGSKVGLIAYSGTAHPVVTACDDYKLIVYQLETLSPTVMPLLGTNLKSALDVADTILSRVEAPSTLLLLTDNITKEQSVLIKEFTRSSSTKVEIIAMATPHGGAIPKVTGRGFIKEGGEDVISKLDQTTLIDLHKESNINVNTLNIDRDDVELIAKNIRENIVFNAEDEESDEEWEEMGYPLLWIAFILSLFWFRRGWMLQFSILLFTFSSCSSTKIDEWSDLWYSPDYQGQMAMDREDYTKAIDSFESLNHKGVAYFKSGDYESAIQIFRSDSSASSLYNLGVSYAANGQNLLAEEALLLAADKGGPNSLIDEALENNRDVLMAIDSLGSFSIDEITELSEEKKRDKLVENKGTTKDEELSSDNEVKELPKDGERITDEVDSGIRKAKELEKPEDNFKPGDGEGAKDILLREISADPSEFLRRRFKYQYDKYYSNEKQLKEIW